jgi:hypothetical protein
MGFIVAEKLLDLYPGASLLLSQGPLPDRARPEFPAEETIRMMAGQICPSCSFAEHDCDFIENWGKGKSVSRQRFMPCGGLLLIGMLCDRKIVDIENYKKIIRGD